MKINKNVIRIGSAVLAGLMIAGTVAPLVSHAAETEKITSIKVTLSGNEYDEFGYPIIEGETKSDKYSVVEVYRINLERDEEKLSDNEYDEGNKNPVEKEEYLMTLEATEDYRFNTNQKKDISLKGADSEVTGISSRESSTQLEIRFKLKGIGEFVGNIPDGSMVKTETVVGWGVAENASTYNLVVTSDVTNRFNINDIGGSQYDLAPIMIKAGNYRVKVAPVSSTGTIGEFSEEVNFSVSQELAARNFEKYKIERVYENTEVPSAGTPVNIGWQQNEKGWFWRNLDGTILQTQWLGLDGKWYYFDENAAMVTNRWIKWKNKDYYFGADGVMLVSTVTPDGYKVDADGAWIK